MINGIKKKAGKRNKKKNKYSVTMPGSRNFVFNLDKGKEGKWFAYIT